MTYHLYPYFTEAGAPPPDGIPEGATIIAVPLDVPSDPRAVGTSVWDELSPHQLAPTPAALDLFRLAVMVYAADTRILRAGTFDAWSRDIVVHLPVHDLAAWQLAKPEVESVLAFLSGDRWTLQLSAGAPAAPARNERLWEKGKKPAADAVMLFSGGLDSFIGAADALERGERLLLVGHYDHGTTSKPQQDAYAVIREKYPDLATQLMIYVQAPIALTGESETSTRSRSFLFVSLAVLVASGLETNRVVIAENAFIALNAPLTTTRLGSLSTRTAHPHTLALMRRIVGALGLSKTVEAPYAFRTKGEMILDSSAREFILDSAPRTMSCAHPGVDHWQKGGNPLQHCGYCLPCLIRRASLARAGRDETDYTYDVLVSLPAEGDRREDLRAVLTAIERSPGRSAITSVLRAGPLSDVPDDIDDYVQAYKRGLAEIGEFLARRKVHTV